jgi:hypothetical protein
MDISYKDFTPKGVFKVLADISYKDFMPNGIFKHHLFFMRLPNLAE